MADKQKRPRSAALGTITRSRRIRIDSGECGDGLTCSSCQKDIPVNADHVVLKSCMCVVCTRCLSNQHARRGSRAFVCPSCNEEVNSHRYHSARTPDAEDTMYAECPYVGEPTDDDIKQKYPRMYLQKEEGEDGFKRLKEGESIAVIYSCRLKKAEGGQIERFTYSGTISQRIETETQMENYCSTLGDFMAFLHELITKPSVIPKEEVPCLRPADIVDYCADRYTQSPLLSSLFGLATGKSQPDFDKVLGDRADHQSQLLAVAGAEGMLLRTISQYPGVFQLMLHEQLSMEAIRQPCLNLLSALRIIPSRKYSSNKKSKDLVEKWTTETGNDLHSLDLVILNHDNFGLQDKSCLAKNVQFTIFQDIVVPKATLYKLNIYGSNRLSRKRTSWEELCFDDADSGTLAERIVGINEEAKKFHSEFVMEDIHQAIMFCMKGLIPAKEGGTIPRLVRIVSSDVKSALLLLQTSRTAAAANISSPSISTGAVRTVEYHPSEDDCVIGSGSMYKNKDAEITLHAIQENLASESTIRMAADYVSNIRQKQLEKHDWEDGEEDPIVDTFAPLMCDGQPCTQYYNLLAEDRSEEDSTKRSYHGVMSFFGGFHTLLKCANCNGEMFDNILKEFVGSWRNSKKKIEWFTNPSDPSQRENETGELCISHPAAAARSLHNKSGKWPSAVEVHNHMMQRAEQYPICALVLLFLRCEVILKMLRASEKIGKRGSVDLFFHCLKLAAPLFAVTHKTDYVRLVCDFLQWYECASPAERVLYDNLIYTQVTSFGRSQWSDLFMEKTIGHLRAQVGRTYRRGSSANLEHACEDIPNMRNQGDIMGGLRTGSTQQTKKGAASKQSVKLFKNSPLVCVSPLVEEMQIWAVSEPPRFEGKDGNIIVLGVGDVRLPGGDSVNPEVLDFVRTGRGRMEEYFQYYNIDHPTETTRSEKHVSLRRILSSNNARRSVLEKDITAATSTNSKELDTLTVSELLMQIEATRQMLNANGVKPQIKPERKSGNKAEKKARLIELRSILFAMDEGAKERERKEIIRQYNVKGLVFKDDMKRILDDPLGLYSVHHSVLQKERYMNTPDLNDNSHVTL